MDINFCEAIKLVTLSLHAIPQDKITEEIKTAKTYMLKMLNFDSSQMIDKHLLVVIEGLDGTGKTSTAKKVVEILNEKYSVKAEFVNSPPMNIRPLRAWFNEQNIDTKIAYYIVGNFIAGKEFLFSAAEILVADRYWPSILAYRTAERDSNQKILRDQNFYCWPNYLPKPYKAGFIFLSIDEKERIQRLCNKSSQNNSALTQLQLKIQHDHTFRNEILRIYKDISKCWNEEWPNASAVEINAIKPFETVVEETINAILKWYTL